jgi:hypothetical protein
MALSRRLVVFLGLTTQEPPTNVGGFPWKLFFRPAGRARLLAASLRLLTSWPLMTLMVYYAGEYWRRLMQREVLSMPRVSVTEAKSRFQSF